MPSTYTSNNKIQKIATGEQSGTWGATTNTNFDLFDTAIDGSVSVTLAGTTHTLNIPDGSAGDGRNKVLIFTGTLAATNTVSITPNTVKKHYYVQNNTTGGQNIVISQGSGSTVTIKPGYSSIVYLNGGGSGAAVKEVLTSLKLTALLEATGAVFVGSSSGTTTLQSAAAASGTLTLPAATDTLVGKATTDTFTNKTFDTAGTGNVLRINGTQVSAVTGTGSVVLATSPTLTTPNIGTPSAGTLTNCTGLPISTGVSGLGSGVATFLATPSSANLASAVTDETGSGALVFANTPSLTTPAIGSGGFTLAGSSSGTTTVAASATASGTITVPAATDTLVGKATTDTFTNKTFDTAGTGNVLKINGTQVSAVTGTGSVVLATSPTLVTPALGTPASGTLTSCTGLPISTGVSGLGTGVATFLATPSSANLASAVTDETGSGALVFGTSPTIATPTITTSAVIPIVNGGTAASSTLTLQSTSGSGTSDAIIFKTASQSESMRITSSGNVGIGTSSPLSLRTLNLEIGPQGTNDGAAVIVNKKGTGIATLRLATQGAASGFDLNFNFPTTGYLGFYDLASGANRMVIDTSGNVGIGTTSPKQLLHVAGQGVFTTSNASYDPGDSTGTAVRIGYSTGGDYGYVICNQTGVASKRLLVGGSTVEFLVSGLEKGRFNADGKFGIGTTSPLTTLQVGAVAALNGDVTLSAGTNMVYQVATDGASLTWNANTNGGNANTIMAQLKPRQDTSANYNLDVFCGTWNNNNSAGTAIATFQSTGRVGIGTASPTYQLQLSTDSAAKPTTNTWTIASDARLKTVKGEYSKGLAEICQVRPVRYEYNGKGGFSVDGKEQISIIAQELAEVFPECVGTFSAKLNESDTEETELYNYNGHAITFALINAIKELKAEIDLLKSRN